MKRLNNKWLFISFCLISLVGCTYSDYKKELEQYAANLKAANSVSSPSPPLVLPMPTVVNYQANKLRDPFIDLQNVATKKILNVNILQAYPVSVIRYVGMVNEGKKTFAFIMLPDNIIYQVGEGEIIGDHQGIVISIGIDGLKIKESVKTGAKGAIERVVTLQLT